MSFLFYCQNYKCGAYLKSVSRPNKVGQKLYDNDDKQIYRVIEQKCIDCGNKMAMEREL